MQAADHGPPDAEHQIRRDLRWSLWFSHRALVIKLSEPRYFKDHHNWLFCWRQSELHINMMGEPSTCELYRGAGEGSRKQGYINYRWGADAGLPLKCSAQWFVRYIRNQVWNDISTSNTDDLSWRKYAGRKDQQLNKTLHRDVICVMDPESSKVLRKLNLWIQSLWRVCV